MHSDLERSSQGKSTIVLLIGALVTLAGTVGLKMSWQIFDFVLNDSSRTETPFIYANMLYHGLWVLVALCTLIAGVSLIISALRRKQYDLIPGPTLYFLGLGLAVIGGFLLLGGFTWQALTLIGSGFFLIYWEWAYHVS